MRGHWGRLAAIKRRVFSDSEGLLCHRYAVDAAEMAHIHPRVSAGGGGGGIGDGAPLIVRAVDIWTKDVVSVVLLTSKEAFSRAVAVLGGLRHDFIPPLLDFQFDPFLKAYTLVHPHFRARLPNALTSLPPSQRDAALLHLARALNFLHAHDVVVLNFHPPHVVQVGNVWTLDDFSRAHRAGEPLQNDPSLWAQLTAPETILKAEGGVLPDLFVSKSVDVWDFGALTYEFCTGRPPFASRAAAAAFAASGAESVFEEALVFGDVSDRVLRYVIDGPPPHLPPNLPPRVPLPRPFEANERPRNPLLPGAPCGRRARQPRARMG
jgi:serine/threonine protein kinase